jgi:hypothetical protein
VLLKRTSTSLGSLVEPEQLGETQFRTVVHRHLGEQDTENLLQVLKEQEGEK